MPQGLSIKFDETTQLQLVPKNMLRQILQKSANVISNFSHFHHFFFEICHCSARNLGEQWENKKAAPGHLGPCSRAPGPLRWSPRSPASWSSALPGAICIDG